MKIIVVDDEKNNLDGFEMEAEGIEGLEIIGTFQNPKEAIAFVKETPVELAVLDVEMPEINGIMLGQRLKEIRPDIALIYVTAYKKYAYDAFRLEASAYILKPFNREDVERAFWRARKLTGMDDGIQKEKKVEIRTFGRFEVFVDGRPVAFRSGKAKELLALLVDRAGGIVTTEEMLTYLWENKPDSDSSRSLCRKVMQRLHNNLEQYGIEDIVNHHSRGRSLEKSKVECDYFAFLEDKEEARNAFYGEYMSNYSWAESTLSRLLLM